MFAHPDDDTFALGGTLLAEADRIAHYTVVVATSGEAGPIADPGLATRENLAEVREAEERAALAAAGRADATVHFLRLPDGGLPDVARDDLVDRVAGLLDEARPDVVVTFGPEGVTLHADHVAIHEAATLAFDRLRSAGEGDAGDGAFRRLFYSQLPQSRLDAVWRQLRSLGQDVDPDAPFMPRGVPDERITVAEDCSGVWERKVEVLRAHRTQVEEIDAFPRHLRKQVFGTEWFVQAWPPVQPGGEPASSLFDGLA